MAEQKTEKLAAYCDKLLLLQNGQQIAYDTPSRIFSRNDLAAYGLEPPVCTTVCRNLSLTLEVQQGEADSAATERKHVPAAAAARYPVTLAETLSLAVRFPKETELLSPDAAPQPNDAAPAPAAAPRQDSAAPVLEVRGLSFSYRKDQPLLSDLKLSFDARPTAIVGQNGAGKTTLVKLLKGLLRPTAGSLFFEGADISTADVASLAGKIGYVFQNPDDQIFKSRVLDEIAFGPQQLGLSRDAALLRAKEALARLELTPLAERNPYDLELAERKLVALASVLAMEPQVLILDEPTIAQDLAGKARIAGVIQRFAAERKPVIAVLHDMDFVAAHFSRVLVMAKGKVLADGAPRMAFYEKEALQKARLAAPQMTALCEALGYQGHYLTPTDLRKRSQTT